MMLDILIPTYNREADLLKNLHILKNQIQAGKLENKIKIIISDNGSQDNTQNSVESFLLLNAQSVEVAYFRLDENAGLEKNTVNVLSKSTAGHVMFLGDDDFLPEGYLEYCCETIERMPSVGCILPGLSSLLRDGSLIAGRRETFNEVTLPPGFHSTWLYSHLGHQMSGVVCSRENLLNDYLSNEQYRNIYLFIYFVTNRLLKFTCIYVPKFKVRVTLFNNKDWSYNQIGLLDEVFKSYYPFVSVIGEGKVRKLMIRFAVMHSYRLNIPVKGFRELIQMYRDVVKKILPIRGVRFAFLAFFLKEYAYTKMKAQ